MMTAGAAVQEMLKQEAHPTPAEAATGQKQPQTIS